MSSLLQLQLQLQLHRGAGRSLEEDDGEDAMDRYQEEADDLSPSKGYTSFILALFVALITGIVIYGLRTYVFRTNKTPGSEDGAFQSHDGAAQESPERYQHQHQGDSYSPPKQNIV